MKFKKNITINLGGWDIKIKSVDKDYEVEGVDTQGYMAVYIPDKKEIVIWEDLIKKNNENYGEVVLHELVHAVCHYCGFPLDEKYHGFVNLIHSALKQLLEEKK